MLSGTIHSSTFPIVINTLRSVDCEPDEIEMHCSAGVNSCPRWFNSTRMPQWNHTQYLVNTGGLAEIRSPLVQRSDDQACLSFDYMIKGAKNYIQVTQINLESDNKETKIWSREDQNMSWTSAKIEVKREFDSDLGIISSTITDYVYLNNIFIKKGKC